MGAKRVPKSRGRFVVVIVTPAEAAAALRPLRAKRTPEAVRPLLGLLVGCLRGYLVSGQMV